MRLTEDGLTLWYGTPDAPAPSAEVPRARAVPIVVGVGPANHANSVEVRYRIDQGPLRIAFANESPSDSSSGQQYFRALLSVPAEAQRVDYCPIARYGDTQVPRPGTETFTTFAMPAPGPVKIQPRFPRYVPRFTPGLQLAGQVSVQLKPPVIIGKTPAGFRLDYYAAYGTLVGDEINAQVQEDSVDYMLVRPDGVGLLDIHATLKTDDGAMITAAYSGFIEFGEDGYRRMSVSDWPELPKLQVAPRLLTESPRYRHFNRVQFVGVGQVDMQALVIKYDIYAVSTLPEPGAWPKP